MVITSVYVAIENDKYSGLVLKKNLIISYRLCFNGDPKDHPPTVGLPIKPLYYK